MRNKGITLIALVITIIILLILAGVTIATLTGEDGILNKANIAKEENQEKTATEIIHLKITNTQLQSYQEKESMPDLQYLADRLYEDNEIQYIYNESKKNANTEKEKITVTGKTIFTKLNDYPYEFEINSSLQLASINGVKIEDNDANVTNYTSVAPKGEPVILDKDFDQTEHTIVAPGEGWIELKLIANGVGDKWYVLSIGSLEETGGTTGVWKDYSVCLPCASGQQINYSAWGDKFTAQLKFIPMQ